MVGELGIVAWAGLQRAVGRVLEDDGGLLGRPTGRDGDLDCSLEEEVGGLELLDVQGVELVEREARSG